MNNFEWKIKIKQKKTKKNDLQRKKENCQLDPKTLKILLQAWYSIANWVKKNTSQIITGTDKKIVTTITKLDIEQSFVKKKHSFKLAQDE